MRLTDAPVLVDFESQSRAELKLVGGRRYWEHPSTEPICCSWEDTHDASRGTWTPGEKWPHRGRLLGAHNMTNFDRFGAYRQKWLKPGQPFVDTSELARMHGLPGKLDALAKRWFGFAKDAKGSRFTVRLSTVRRPSGKNNPDTISVEDWRALTKQEKRERGVQRVITDADRERVVEYCESDVEPMALAWPELHDALDIEPDVRAADIAINDRGVYFDVQLATRLLECDARNGDKVCTEVGHELGWSPAKVRRIANSPQKFARFAHVSDAQAKTIENILARPKSYSRRAVGLARARQAIASIARGKLRAGLARVSPDGRLRDIHRIYGAHTWRWSGQGIQPQNLPRPDKQFKDWKPDDVRRLAERVRDGKHNATQAEVDLLLRACFTAAPGRMLAVCDYSGVEARMLAWLAGDERALAVFRSGEDPYRVMAATIFAVRLGDVESWQRDVGKAAELGCGYQMGGLRFNEHALKSGVDLEVLGVDSFAVVATWRRLHKPIVDFWYRLQRAMVAAVRGEACQVACFEFRPSNDGKSVAVFLPTGRPVLYNAVRVNSEGRVSYLNTHNMREDLYGGKICENLVQALCRELLARTLVRLERDGLDPVLHVHDEAACEVPRSAAEDGYEVLRYTMMDLERWAKGFPVGAKGFWGERYMKG